MILMKTTEMIKLILTSTLHSVDGNSGDSTSVGGKTSPGQPTLQGCVHDDHDHDGYDQTWNLSKNLHNPFFGQ